MPLTHKAIDDLKKIHFEEYGEKLTNDEAWEMGVRLISLAKTLCTVKKTKTEDKNSY